MKEIENLTLDGEKVKLTEYATAKDLETLKASGVQQTPLFANDVLECTDQTKVYVLPDGYIYGYAKTTTEKEKETVVSEAKAAVVLNKRYSLSGKAFKDAEGYSSVIVPVESKGESDRFVIKGIDYTDYWAGIYYGASNTVFTGSLSNSGTASEITLTGIPAGKYYVLYHTATTSGFATINVNGVTYNVVTSADGADASFKVVETTIETVTTWGFVNTGVKYGSNVTVDDALSDKSTNPIQNKVVQAKFKELESNINGIKKQTTNIASYIGTVQAPSPQLPADGSDASDVNLNTCLSDDIHSLLQKVVKRYPNYITRELMGKDESDTFDIYRYTLGKKTYTAWQKDGYPKMYAWANDSTTVYSESVAPRIGDTMYSAAYIGTAYGVVTAVSATKRSRTVNGVDFVRDASKDVDPTLLYYPTDTHIYRDRLYTLSGGMMLFTNIKKTMTADSITLDDGTVYQRYPFGDLDKDCKKRIPMTIIANEHGGVSEPRDCALVVARLIQDLCSGTDNPVLNYIRDYVNLTVIPVVNPHGWNRYDSAAGYRNANGVNVNRNYDTPGWDAYLTANPSEAAEMGEYPGSENETQYTMNTMSESGAKIAISVHGIGKAMDIDLVYYQGQNPDGAYKKEKIEEIREDYFNRYGLMFVPYNPLACTPEETSKSPSYITQIGAYGGIIEFNCNDAQIKEGGANRRYTAWTMEQQYTLLLKFIAMWLSDYEENK